MLGPVGSGPDGRFGGPGGSRVAGPARWFGPGPTGAARTSGLSGREVSRPRGTLHGMRRLFPVTDETAETVAPTRGEGEWSLAELAEAYAYPEPEPEAGAGGPGVWLRANMVSTLDGAGQHDG